MMTKRTRGRMYLCLFIMMSFTGLLLLSIPNQTVKENTLHVMSQNNKQAHSESKVVAFDRVQTVSSSDLKTLVKDEIKVVPGGQSIGVQLQTAGILVVGHHAVKGKTGTVSPGEEAKVHVGDIIVEINGKPVEALTEIKPYVSEAGKKNEELKVKLKRGKETIETSLHPIFDESEQEYKIGLYIRDSAAGIGTMTFYEPETKRYGALGHVIADINTKKPIEMMAGTIVRSSVVNIEKGNSGTPGEKQAKFSAERNKLGSIIKNTPHGIFGVLDTKLSNGSYDEPLEITRSDEVKEGPAKILTVVDKEKVEEFDIEIVSSTPQKKPDIKGMVLKITDPKLLEKTGGIVQGMSGSPIIQDGKVVGAVTHVFVNDPTSGYGVHIEWMLRDAGINLQQVKKHAS